MPTGAITGATAGYQAGTQGMNQAMSGLSGISGMLPFIGPMVQGGIGLFQGLSNLFAPKAERPVQEVPESMRQATANAERLASMNQMPGYANTVGQLDTATGSALNTLKESQGGNADLSQSVADLVGKKNEALIGLGTQNANFKVGTNQALQAQLNAQAGAEQAAFDYNEKDLYDSEAAAESAMTQASLSNVFNAANTAAGVGAYNNLAKMYGQQNVANNPYSYLFGQRNGQASNQSANNGVSNTSNYKFNVFDPNTFTSKYPVMPTFNIPKLF
jgi:hypothetical protein